MSADFHERYAHPDLQLPPERSTGLVFTAVALAVAYFWRANVTVLTLALGLAAVLAFVSFVTPHVLRPLNILWMRFALLLSKVMNPIVMLVLFAITIIPAGLIMQRLRDPLRRRRSGTEQSYWIDRRPQEQTSMRNQF